LVFWRRYIVILVSSGGYVARRRLNLKSLSGDKSAWLRNRYVKWLVC
jgi:hypothetical protein